MPPKKKRSSKTHWPPEPLSKLYDALVALYPDISPQQRNELMDVVLKAILDNLTRSASSVPKGDALFTPQGLRELISHESELPGQIAHDLTTPSSRRSESLTPSQEHHEHSELAAARDLPHFDPATEATTSGIEFSAILRGPVFELVNSSGTATLRVAVDSGWSAREFSELLSSLDDIYNFLFTLEIFRAAKTIGNLDVGNIPRRSSLLRGSPWIVPPDNMLRVQRLQYNSPGVGDLAGLGVAIGHIKEFLQTIIAYVVANCRESH